MPSNERLADNIIDIVRDGGLKLEVLREIFTNNVLYEQLVTLSADLEVAWNAECAEHSRTDALTQNLERALAEARPTKTMYQFGRAAS